VVSVLGRLTVELAGTFSLVYPSVEELVELEEPESFLQLLKIISEKRIIVAEIIEFLMTHSK